MIVNVVEIWTRGINYASKAWNFDPSKDVQGIRVTQTLFLLLFILHTKWFVKHKENIIKLVYLQLSFKNKLIIVPFYF